MDPRTRSWRVRHGSEAGRAPYLHKTWRTVHTAGIHVREARVRTHTHADTHTYAHTFPLFFHEINKFPAHKTQHGRGVHVICEACQHGVVINVRRARDRFSTPTSLVLTFCRNNVTVEVEDVRKGGRRKSTGEKKLK